MLLIVIGFTLLLLRGCTAGSDSGAINPVKQGGKKTPHSRKGHKKLLREKVMLYSMLEVYKTQTTKFGRENQDLEQYLKENVTYEVADLEEATKQLEKRLGNICTCQDKAVDWAFDSAEINYNCEAPALESDDEVFPQKPESIFFEPIEHDKWTSIHDELKNSYGRLEDCEKVLELFHVVFGLDPYADERDFSVNIDRVFSFVDQCMIQLMLANIALHERMRTLIALKEKKSEALTSPNEEGAEALTTQEEDSETSKLFFSGKDFPDTLSDSDIERIVEEDERLSNEKHVSQLPQYSLLPPSLMGVKSAPQPGHTSLDKPALKRSLSNPDLQQRNTATSELEET